MKGGLDAEIEQLYQLPLADFTAARNALAKGAGKRAGEIRALAKPSVPAWAVNQLYWKKRSVYDALMEAAQEMRRAHGAVLSGRAADVRAAGKAHDERVNAALDAALELMIESGHAPTDATRQAILTTLRALPGEEPPGQLTGALQPGGFEALAGLSIKGAKGSAVIKPMPRPAAPREKAAKKEDARDARAIARAREAVAEATQALKEAEHAAQREEFERARAGREHEKALKRVAAAKQALEEAETEVRTAEDAADAAARKKDAAERRAQVTEKAVDTARAALEKARQQLDDL